MRGRCLLYCSSHSNCSPLLILTSTPVRSALASLYAPKNFPLPEKEKGQKIKQKFDFSFFDLFFFLLLLFILLLHVPMKSSWSLEKKHMYYFCKEVREHELVSPYFLTPEKPNLEVVNIYIYSYHF